jgi:hypothetical protein
MSNDSWVIMPNLHRYTQQNDRLEQKEVTPLNKEGLKNKDLQVNH